MDEDILEETLDKLLFEMAKDGQVLASCPSCSIPLDIPELTAYTCRTCGIISPEKIIWKSAAFQANC